MGTATKIEWAEHTASPWYGCSRVHTGCINCYAEALAKRNPRTLGVWGPEGTRVASGSFHRNVAKWHRYAVASKTRASVFPSLCDPFEGFVRATSVAQEQQRINANRNGQTIIGGQPSIQDSQGNPLYYCDHCCKATPGSVCCSQTTRTIQINDLRRGLFATIDACPWLDFLLLTKRPQNIRSMWCSHINTDGKPPSQLYRQNVQLIYSASDQASLDAGADHLLKCNDLCPLVGLSLEPLVGPMPKLYRWLNNHELNARGEPVCTSCFLPTARSYAHYPVPCWNCGGKLKCGPRIGWVIVGGESGHGARPCRPEWIRSIVAQCKAANVPCFVKQLGGNVVTRNDMVEDHFNSLDTGWPDPEVEHHIHGFREDYQGADCRILLRDKKGGDSNEWPADLRVRELPEVPHA